MKKLLSIFLVGVMLFALASCGTDFARYSTLEMPIEGLHWGMSLEQVKKVLDEQKISYTEKTEETETKKKRVNLTLEQGYQLYGFALEVGGLQIDEVDGLFRVAGSFKETDKEKVVDTVAEEVGEFKKSENMESMGLELWFCTSTDENLNTLKDDKLTKKVEQFWLECYKPLVEEDKFGYVSPEEMLEKFMEKPLAYVEIRGGKVGSDRVSIVIEGSTAAMVYQIDSLGAEGYYNKLLENKE